MVEGKTLPPDIAIRLIDGWQETDRTGAGLTVAEAIDLVAADPGKYQVLRDVIVELTDPGKPPSTKSIGMRLHHLRGHVIGGKCFAKLDRRHTAVWKVLTEAGSPTNENEPEQRGGPFDWVKVEGNSVSCRYCGTNLEGWA